MDETSAVKTDNQCSSMEQTGSSAREMKTGTLPYSKKIIMLYDTQSIRELMCGLTAVANQESNCQPEVNQAAASVTSTSFDKTSCLTCRCIFDSRGGQADHFKSDWHRLNLHRLTRGIEPVSEVEFARLASEEDVSSISGSDSSASADDSDDYGFVDTETSTPDDIKVACHHREKRRLHQQKFLFRNSCGQLLAIHRCVVGATSKGNAVSPAELVAKVQILATDMHWAVLMASGGHFAGAIFDGSSVTHHKTFHRYVVRAKRGTCQSARDGKGGNAPKSAGATLRRHNEAAFSQEIKELLASWSEPLKRCCRIFLRAPGHNRSIFFSAKEPLLSKVDPRLSLISMETRRPTFRELMRVHGLLASVECFEENSSAVDKCENAPSLYKNVNKRQLLMNGAQDVKNFLSDVTTCRQSVDGHSQSAASVPCPADRLSVKVCGDDVSIQEFGSGVDESSFACQEEAVTELLSATTFHSTEQLSTAGKALAISEEVDSVDKAFYETYNQLYTACKTGDTVGVKQVLGELVCDVKKTDESHDDELETKELAKINDDVSAFVNYQTGPKSSTLLHVASKAGHVDVIRILLEHGADPTLKDAQNQLPYVISGSKEVKQEYRRFMADHMDMYDYVRAQIPGPLTEQMEIERKAKAAEKKKMQRKATKERLKEEKVEEEKRKAEEHKKLEEEQRKLQFLSLSDREKRALAAERRLKNQMSTASTLSRCWQCGADITGKVPFEYYDYKFCSPACLKEHRFKQPQD